MQERVFAEDHWYIPLGMHGSKRLTDDAVAVMPYFPYSRQSKKKTHRGAITARMIANLMRVAGVDHVITIDLHASQMQGFFKCPVDNLRAEPLIVKWVKLNIKDWQDAVVVSKNPGGTKRVTSLADALQVSFGIVTTDRRRPHMPSSMYNSAIFEPMGTDGTNEQGVLEEEAAVQEAFTPERHDFANGYHSTRSNGFGQIRRPNSQRAITTMSASVRTRLVNGDVPSSPLANSQRADSIDPTDPTLIPEPGVQRATTVPGVQQANHDDDGYESPWSDNEDVDPVCQRILGFCSFY
jgi:ribose-phosphate pyrophosphokinase